MVMRSPLETAIETVLAKSDFELALEALQRGGSL